MFKVTKPLKLIHTDIQGFAFMLSLEGFRYSIVFVDNFSKFVWILPLKAKSETKEVFLKFQVAIERQLESNIKVIQSDQGKEFKSLALMFQEKSITFKHPCLYNHQQNDKVKRKQRHLVDTGLTLLSQAHLPISFLWLAI